MDKNQNTTGASTDCAKLKESKFWSEVPEGCTLHEKEWANVETMFGTYACAFQGGRFYSVEVGIDGVLTVKSRIKSLVCIKEAAGVLFSGDQLKEAVRIASKYALKGA